MMRVVKQAIILIEPLDDNKLFNFFKKFIKFMIRGKRQADLVFEPAGNFLYRISLKELKKTLCAISGYNFDWKAKVIRDRGGEDGFFVRKKDVGIIAQEIEKVWPEIVATREEGNKAVKYEKLVPLLIESIKELSERKCSCGV